MVRIAVLGCGRIARMIHLPVLAGLEGVQIVAIADPDEEARAAASAQIGAGGGVAVAGSWRETLGHPGVDAAIICLPSGMHAEVAAEALHRGVHVFIEKPVATDAAQGAALAEAADGAPGVVAMPAFNYRFHRTWGRMRQRLAEGSIGDVVAVRTAFCVPGRVLPEWKSARALGGGCLLDQFSHHADLLAWLLDGVMGPGALPERVLATVRSVTSEWDTASVQTTLACGVVVESLLSMTAAEMDRIEVIGTRGRLVGDRLAGQVWFERASAGYTRRSRGAAVVASGARAMGLARHLLQPGGSTGHAGALAEFRDAVRDARAPSVTLEDGLRSLAWVLAAEEAGRTGRGVEPSPIALTRLTAQELPESSEVRVTGLVPEVSIVLVVSHVDHTVREVVRCVRAQTMAPRAELVVVAPGRERAGRALGLPRGAQETMGSVRIVETGCAIRDVDAEAARGVREARAEVVAIIEDHAFPEPDWAEVLLEGHRAEGGPWGAVGSCIVNANPATGMSWMNLLLGYGAWCPPLSGGETAEVSLHNISLKRSAVAGYGESLGARMGRGGDLLADLVRSGYRLRVEPRARVRHINPSRVGSSVELRFNGGRMYAAGKSRGWPAHRRYAYAAMWPVIPLLRARLLRRKVPEAGWRIAPAVAMGLVLDGLGQATGFALGPGESRRRLAAFELDRLRHLVPSDRRSLVGAHEGTVAVQGTRGG